MENFTGKQIQEAITSIEVGQKYWDNDFEDYIEVLGIDIDSDSIRLKGANENTQLIRKQDGSFVLSLRLFVHDILERTTILQK